MTVTLLRSPQVCSCSRARRGRCRRRRAGTDLPWAWKCLASLPIEVVLPAPLTPAIMMMNGRWRADVERRSSGSSSSCRASESLAGCLPASRWLVALGAALSVVEQMLGRFHADVAGQQQVSSSSSSSSSTCRGQTSI